MAGDRVELLNLDADEVEHTEAQNTFSRIAHARLSKRMAYLLGIFVIVPCVVLVVVPRNVLAPSGHATKRFDLAANVHDSIEEVVENSWNLADWPTITCPAMGALFRAGDLVPDPDGFIFHDQTVDAMLRIGMPVNLVEGITRNNFEDLDKINIFKMNLADPENPAEGENVEHDFSTGIRDPLPNEDKFREFQGFIGTDGDAENWSQTDIAAAVIHFEANSNDFGTAPKGIGTYHSLLMAFGKHKSLSKIEFKELVLQSEYPEEFKVKRAKAIQRWDLEHPTL